MAARKDRFSWPGKLFWLAWGIVLVGQGNRIEAIQNLPDVRFLFLCLCPRLCQNANTTLSLQWSMKIGNIVRVGTLRYLTKITTLWKTDREQLRPSKAFATIAMYSWWQSGGVECVLKLKPAEVMHMAVILDYIT